LRSAEGFGAPPSTFIAPLVEHGLAQGIAERLVVDGSFRSPPRAPAELLRFAAQAMLQGDDQHAPFGWTHCLTLAQGAQRAGAHAGSGPVGIYVAMIYLLAHWGAYGSGTVDLTRIPPPPHVELVDALTSSPADAASAAWHAPDRDRTVRVLASAAATN